jgi:DNA polymerase-1
MSLAFRAYFALSTDIATSSGLVTNALHGFASMLNLLVKSHKPRALVVAFDLAGGTFRDDMTEDYKGGRDATPEDLDHQFDLIRDFCEVLHIPVLGVPGYEADDVLATLATWGRDQKIETIIVTGDRDSFQLVEDPFVKVLYNRRGVSDYALYDEAGIFEKYGIQPQRYELLAALRGDTSDNLPGVPGVGEKTAAKLLAQYPDFDALFAHVDDQTPKLRENLSAFEARARNNALVMKLIRDVPLDFTPDQVQMGGWDRTAVSSFFERFEMNAMRQRYEKLFAEGLLGPSGEGGATPPTPKDETTPVREMSVQKSAEAVLKDLACVTVVVSGERAVALNPSSYEVWCGEVSQLLTKLADRSIAGHDVKPLYRRAYEKGIALADPKDDSAIMAFLVDATNGDYQLSDVAARHLGEHAKQAAPSLFGEERSDEDLIAEVGQVDRLINRLRGEVDEWKLEFVYHSIELPLIAVLGRMEAVGIHVDVAMLQTITNELTAEVTKLEKEIQRVAGREFKVNSPQQLQTVLFDDLGLKPTKKIKSGYSTDANSLEAIVNEHEIIPLILRFREVDKLRGTYGQSLIATVGPDSRIHATFHQTVARTGRLSSDSPNLHNIPVRTQEGRRLRFAFGPTPGWELMVADYNQIELRILAHLSKDPGLLEAFSTEQDVHRAIAAVVFQKSPEDVTHDEREKAKAVSYGLAYGMEAFGLSQRLGISVSEAKAIMDQYFEGFPTLRSYMEATVRDVRAQGYSRTEYGRIRPFADLATASGPQRQAAERQAMNAGIQGLAADIFKFALVRLDHGLHQAKLEARLILQVHDEVLVEAPASEKMQVESIVRESLQGAAKLSVPLEVSLHWGENWAAAKG